MHAPR
jgi:hypothetical protein